MDLQKTAPGLVQGRHGIWYGAAEAGIRYPDDGHDRCAAVEAGSFWFQHRNACIVAMARAFPPAEGGAIVDVGRGNGVVALALQQAGFPVVLVEPGSAGAHHARRRGVRQVVCATTGSAGFLPRTLPAVGLFDVVEHIEDEVAFLQGIRRLTEPGGRLYLTVPAWPWLWSREDDDAGHVRRHTPASIRAAVQAAGFQVDFATCIFRPLPWPILVRRVLPFRLGLTRTRADAGQVARDHAVDGGLAARVLGWLLHAELGRLAALRPMRFGGSCLVVATRPA
jgi:SAM-dependent methyltransferase